MRSELADLSEVEFPRGARAALDARDATLISVQWDPTPMPGNLPANARPYNLRHSFASLLLHEGRSVIYVARQLGDLAFFTRRDLSEDEGAAFLAAVES